MSRTPIPVTSRVDLVDADAVRSVLRVTTAQLVEMVERGDLAAYDLDGTLRFRALEVAKLAASRRLEATDGLDLGGAA